jgi:protein required for attachment to host cells
MHAKVTWILVADGQHAAVYRNDGPGKGLQAVPGLGGQRTGARSHDMMSDKPGRDQGFAGASGSSGMTPRSDPHETAERHFTEGVARQLDAAATDRKYERLILVAPPRTLGILRQALAAPTLKLVSAELDKDLTKSPVTDLAKHLEAHLAV